MLIYKKGVTLVEMMVAVAIISIGIAGSIVTFQFFNVGIQSSKMRSLANNIAQERVEFLKNKSYYRILVTTATAEDDNFSPSMVYDVGPNGQESVSVGGVNFIRRVYIRKVNENSSGNLAYFSWTQPDTGLKEITIYVLWLERGKWKKLELKNLINNPNRVNQSSAFSGNVTNIATGVAIEGAVVRAQENPSQYAETTATGDYSFSIEAGSYTLLATKQGYFPKTLPTALVAANQTLSGQDFQLTQMSSGSIIGSAYIRDHLVISQVVASTVMADSGVNIEYVELYNPTTWHINISDGSGGNTIKLRYLGENGAGHDVEEFVLSYISTWVAPGKYYLIANSFPLTVAGASPITDALFGSIAVNPHCGLFGVTTNCIWAGQAGAVQILDDEDNVIDTVGWSHGASGKNAPAYEGTQLAMWNGFPTEWQLRRKSEYNHTTAGSGRAYDSDTNNVDFEFINPIDPAVPPYSTFSGVKAPLTGTPAAGAVVFADDSLSSPVVADAQGYFNLTNVSTGTWRLYVASGTYFTHPGYYGGTSGAFVSSAGNLLFTSPTAYGFITGRVTDVLNNTLSDIKVYTPGSPQATTNASGIYTLPASTGTVNITANYQNQNGSYVELSSMNVVVEAGTIIKDVDFALYLGGKITGRVTTNGVDPLPNIPVIGLKDGVEQGNGISDANGYFIISGAGVSTGAYVVVPQLESGETSSPASSTVTLTAGSTIFAATYTVSGAFGYITGKVTLGGYNGPPITTGVLLYAVSTTLSATPPDITPALRSGGVVYYSESSNALGEYSIAVRGGSSYTLAGWYTTWNVNTSSTVKRAYDGSNAFYVLPSSTVVKNFFW